MADHTPIEWTDATWNPITGCSVVSPGCTNCYAMRLAGTRLRNHQSRIGLTRNTKAGPVWNGQLQINEQWLDQPLRWSRPRRIFVCAHGDLFHEHTPTHWIDQVVLVMSAAERHTFQVLTKRAARMREYFNPDLPARLCHLGRAIQRDEQHPLHATISAVGWSQLGEAGTWPLPNVWLGVSAEDQFLADERIAHLVQTPAALRFVSAEPLLAPLYTMTPWLTGGATARCIRTNGIDWVIAGGESGHGARPMHPDWVRSLRDQCVGAGVPFFFKQWGEFKPATFAETVFEHRARGAMMRPDGSRPSLADLDAMCAGTFDYTGYQQFAAVGKKAAGATLDGREWRETPA
jgi:protein gp37